jgi:transmembrane sensor
LGSVIPSSRQIEERAAAWLARRDSGSWSEDDERRLQAWLDASTAHAVAFIRLESAWTQARRLKALGAGMPRNVVPPPDAWHKSPFFAASAHTIAPARRRFPRALVAGIVAVAMTGLISWYGSARGPYYRTPIGSIASVPMTDGSEITLNTDSAIRVAISARERRVQLDQGEAFFEVAKDPSRPFVVSAGSKRIIAVGTKFSVRRIGNDIRVFVTEGKVRFEDNSLGTAAKGSADSPGSAAQGASPASSDESAPAGSSAILLPAGTISLAGDSGILVQTKPLPEVEEYLSWRSGYLVFRETPLADAAGEFNRYNDIKIVVQDPEVATIALSGRFRATNFEAFVRLIEDGFPVRVRRADGRIILSSMHAAVIQATTAH